MGGGPAMRAGAYETLLGRFADGAPVEALAPVARRIRSVRDNLARLYGTRQGSVAHLPDFGLPDLAGFFGQRAEGARRFESELRRVTLKYEPRLEEVRVAARPGTGEGLYLDAQGRLRFELECRLRGGARLRLAVGAGPREAVTVEEGRPGV